MKVVIVSNLKMHIEYPMFVYKRHVSNVFPAISFTSLIAKVIRKASTNSSTSSFTHVGVSTFDVRYMSGQIKNRTLNFN